MFTKDQGLQIQAEFLSALQTVLSKDAYAELLAHCENKNKELPESASGFDVFRGQDLISFVLYMANRNVQVQK